MALSPLRLLSLNRYRDLSYRQCIDRRLTALRRTSDLAHCPAYYSTRGVSHLHPGMRAMLALMQDGRAWAKLTAPYRLDANGAPYVISAKIARWLVEHCPQRLVWGSDWPHVMVKDEMPHDADLLNATTEWIPEPRLQQAIFSDNPATLYQWE